jgi:hypothetical protein
MIAMGSIIFKHGVAIDQFNTEYHYLKKKQSTILEFIVRVTKTTGKT